MPKKAPLDVYQTVTDSIVAAIEANPGTYHMPWHRSGLGYTIPRHPVTEQLSNGVNILSLWVAAELNQYPTTLFASRKQWAYALENVPRASDHRRGRPVAGDRRSRR